MEQATQLDALVDQKLQQGIRKMEMKQGAGFVMGEHVDENPFDDDEDINKYVCDFRTMAKMIKSSRKDGVKRLQEGPRRAREATAQRKRTGNILRKLVERIAQEIPEIKMGEETRRKHKEKSKNMRDRQRDVSSHEECLAMLGDMTIYKKATIERK